MVAQSLSMSDSEFKVARRPARDVRPTPRGYRLRHATAGAVFLVSAMIGAPAMASLTTIGVGVGILVMGVVEVGVVYTWLNSRELNANEKIELQKAIDHLKASGFKKEAEQVERLLKDGYLLRGSAVDGTIAQTHGGALDGLMGSGFINLESAFFKAKNDGGILNITDEQRTRFQAMTLIHELVHLNEQANKLNLPLARPFKMLSDNPDVDPEYRPHEAHIKAMPALGYTKEEIQAILDNLVEKKSFYAKYKPIYDEVIANYDKYVNLADGGAGSKMGGVSDIGTASGTAAPAGNGATAPLLPHPGPDANHRQAPPASKMKGFR